MSELRKCDRCGEVVPATDSQDVFVCRSEQDNSTDATYPDVDRGKTVHRKITPNPVDLCKWCRQDLDLFFKNRAVEPRKAAP